MSEHDYSGGFFSRALKDVFGSEPEDIAPGGQAGEAADDLSMRKTWRKRKVEALTRGEDFPSFSEFKAQQGGE